MATTGRAKGRGGVFDGAVTQRDTGRILRRRDVAFAAAVAVAGVVPMIAPKDALAQKWTIDAGVASQLTWTSNAGLDATRTGSGSSDAIVDVRPHIRLLAEGARLKLSGSAALSAVKYANGTQPTRLQPDVDLTASLVAIERLLFLDGGLRATQISANAFGARPEQGTTSENSVTTTRARFAPRIEGQAGNLLRYRLVSDNSWTRESGATTTVPGANVSGYFGRHQGSLTQDPKPLGWRIAAQRDETRYRDALQDPLVIDLARATLLYAVTSDLTVGVGAGHERKSFTTQNSGGNLLGFEATWQPSPRTLVAASEEKRFFGSSWKLAFDHRTPQIAWNIGAQRSVQTTLQSLLDLPATGNVAALLDAIFTTRFPDPVERAQVVNDLIARQGLPTSTLQPISLRSQRLSVVTLANATVTLIGVRNSLSLTAFQARTEDALDSGPLATGSALTNNTQVGAAVTLTHRLSATMALAGSADWRRIRALQANGERSVQRTAALRLNVDVEPKTTAFAGARLRGFDSTTTTTDRQERAVFVGVDHRF